jgi:predicted transcriptional regulator with HTH domain
VAIALVLRSLTRSRLRLHRQFLHGIYPQRAEALAAARAGDPAPAAGDMAGHFWRLRGWRPDREL